MAVSDLEKRKRTNFQEKHYADARANIKQKPEPPEKWTPKI